MEVKEYFKEEDLNKANKIVQTFHGRILLDTSIKNPSAVLMSIYMSCNKSKKPSVSKSVSKELFIFLGRKSDEFDKAIYELSGKRKGKKKFIDSNKEEIGLNFNGLKKLKRFLKE